MFFIDIPKGNRNFTYKIPKIMTDFLDRSEICKEELKTLLWSTKLINLTV